MTDEGQYTLVTESVFDNGNIYVSLQSLYMVQYFE